MWKLQLIVGIIKYCSKAQVIRLVNLYIQLIIFFGIAGLVLAEAHFPHERVILDHNTVILEELERPDGVVHVGSNVTPTRAVRANHVCSMTNVIVREVKIFLLDNGAMRQSDRYPVIFVLEYLPRGYFLFVAKLPVKQGKFVFLLPFAFDFHVIHGDVGMG
jgi:hypothetical protein